VAFQSHDPALHLLQAARDEAHRFAVSHHRKQRKKRTLTSGLDTVPGIGPTLRKRLLRSFGSLKRLKQADADAIAAIPGVGRKKAEAIVEALAPKS
jgi:excinuclease ABC subunit C